MRDHDDRHSVWRGHSVYLYQRRADTWSLVLAYEADNYDTIEAAHALVQYGVSSAAGSGPALIVAHVTPWCTSNWQGLRYAVLRPTSDPYSPNEIGSGGDLIYLGVDTPYTLELTASGFSLSFLGERYSNMVVAGTGAGADDPAARQVLKFRVGELGITPVLP